MVVGGSPGPDTELVLARGTTLTFTTRGHTDCVLTESAVCRHQLWPEPLGDAAVCVFLSSQPHSPLIAIKVKERHLACVTCDQPGRHTATHTLYCFR